jgi:hypothetical protein
MQARCQRSSVGLKPVLLAKARPLCYSAFLSLRRRMELKNLQIVFIQSLDRVRLWQRGRPYGLCCNNKIVPAAVGRIKLIHPCRASQFACGHLI